METLLYAAVPFLVTIITSLFKRLPGLDTMKEGMYLTSVRFFCALLSFIGVIAASYVAGESLNPASVETFVLTFMTFMSSVGVHYLGKKK